MFHVPYTCEYFSKKYDINYDAICFLLEYSIYINIVYWFNKLILFVSYNYYYSCTQTCKKGVVRYTFLIYQKQN